MSDILVFGGAHIDRRARIGGDTVPGASNPGTWFEEAGGGGFNAARTLARIGHSVAMVAPRGGDIGGDIVAQAARAAGVLDCPFTFLDRRTPSYTAILERDGNLVIGLADMDLYKLFTPRRLAVRALRDRMDAAKLVICDANLPEDTIAALAGRISGRGKTLAAIAISPAKVTRYRQSLGGIDWLFMNEAEACALSGETTGDWREWPAILGHLGLRGGVITRGAKGMIAFDGKEVVTLSPPALPALADVTGAGDSLAGGTLSGLISGLPLSQALRRGAACASLTIASPLAVSETLSRMTLETALGLVPDAEILS